MIPAGAPDPSGGWIPEVFRSMRYLVEDGVWWVLQGDTWVRDERGADTRS